MKKNYESRKMYAEKHIVKYKKNRSHKEKTRKNILENIRMNDIYEEEMEYVK